jgi:hypothetical protein
VRIQLRGWWVVTGIHTDSPCHAPGGAVMCLTLSCMVQLLLLLRGCVVCCAVLCHVVLCRSMTPLDKVFMLPADARLNQQTMRAILASGHSRIPVYTRGDRWVQL